MSLTTGPDVIREDKWNHVVMTYDNAASEINVYVDGNLVGQQAVQVDTTVSGGFKDMIIGDGIDGFVDDVEVYGRALSRDDAVRLATEGRYAKSVANTYHNLRITDFKRTPTLISDQNTTRQYQVQNGKYDIGVTPGTRSLDFEGNGYISFGNDEIIGDDSDAFTVSAWIKLKTEKTFVVTAEDGKYKIDGNPTPTLQLYEGQTYVFDVSALGITHPFRLSTVSDGGGGQPNASPYQYTVGYNSTDNRITVADGAPSTLYYYCTNHSGMGGDITVSTSSGVPPQRIMHKTGVIDFFVENNTVKLKLGDQAEAIAFTPVTSPGVPEIDDSIFPDGLVKGSQYTMPINVDKITLSGYVKKGAGFDSATKFHPLFALGGNDELNFGILRDASAGEDKFELRAKRPSLISSAYVGLWNTEFNLAMENSTQDNGGGRFENTSSADVSFLLTLKDVKRRATLKSVSFTCPVRSRTPSRVRISSLEDGGNYSTILDMPIAFKSASHVYKFVMGTELNAGVNADLANPKSDVIRVEFLRAGAIPVRVDKVDFSAIIEETLTATALVTDTYQTVKISGTVSGYGGGGTLKVFKTSADRDANTNPFMTLTPDANGYFEGTEFDGRASGDANAPNGRDGTYSYFFAKTTDDRDRRIFADSISASLREQYEITNTNTEVLQDNNITGGVKFNKIRFSGITNTSGIIRIYVHPFTSSYTQVACVRGQPWSVDRTTETVQGTYTYRYWLSNTPPGQSTRYHWAADLGHSNDGFQVYLYDFTFNISPSKIYVRKGSNNFARPTYSGTNYSTPSTTENTFNKNQAHTQTITYTAGNSLGSGSIQRNLEVVVYNVGVSVANYSHQNIKSGHWHHTLVDGNFNRDNVYLSSSSGYPGLHVTGDYKVTHNFKDSYTNEHVTTATTTIKKYVFSRTTFKNISYDKGQSWGWYNMVSSWGQNSQVIHAEENWHPYRSVSSSNDSLKNSVGSHGIRFYTRNGVTHGEGAWNYATAHVINPSRTFYFKERWHTAHSFWGPNYNYRKYYFKDETGHQTSYTTPYHNHYEYQHMRHFDIGPMTGHVYFRRSNYIRNTDENNGTMWHYCYTMRVWLEENGSYTEIGDVQNWYRITADPTESTASYSIQWFNRYICADD